MSSFKKDYKTLYEATKIDLAEQIDYTFSLEEQLASAKNQLADYQTSGQIDLRERLATEIFRRWGSWDNVQADAMEKWITSDIVPNKKLYGDFFPQPTKKTNSIPSKPKKKRKYTKRSKSWKKKSAKKSA